METTLYTIKGFDSHQGELELLHHIESINGVYIHFVERGVVMIERDLDVISEGGLLFTIEELGYKVVA